MVFVLGTYWNNLYISHEISQFCTSYDGFPTVCTTVSSSACVSTSFTCNCVYNRLCIWNCICICIYICNLICICISNRTYIFPCNCTMLYNLICICIWNCMHINICIVPASVSVSTPANVCATFTASALTGEHLNLQSCYLHLYLSL